MDERCLRGDGVVVDGGYFHYLAHVRRLKKGCRVSAVIGGRVYDLAVREVGKAAITFEILETRRAAERMPCEIFVHLALLKANKLDFAVSRLSELGVRELVLIATERSASRSSVGSGRSERWERLAREGAKVSGTERLMRVRGPVGVSAVDCVSARGKAAALGRQGPAGAVLVFTPGTTNRHVRDVLDELPAGGTARYDLFFGPEGGFTDGEMEMLAGAGGIRVTMGDLVLRSETAAVVGTGFVRVYGGKRVESTCTGTDC